MIGEDHVGRLEPLHADLFDLVRLECKHNLGQDPDQPGQIPWLADGIFCGFITLLIFDL